MRKKSYSRIADTQLNIRTDSLTLHAFRSFCSRTQLTQNEALKLLLQSSGQDVYEKFNPLRARLQQQAETIAELQKVNNELRHKHAEKHRRFIDQRRDWVCVMDKMLVRIVDRYGACPGGVEPLKRIAFKVAKEKFDFTLYRYPERADCFVLTIDFIAYGTGVAAPLFICGKDETGSYVKLRWYPKEEYLGLTPRAERYVYGGAPWLVGCLQATDGAMDIIAGIPFADSINQDDRTDNKEPVCMHDMLGKSSLDVLIARLEGIKDEHAENRLDSSRLNTIANKQ